MAAERFLAATEGPPARISWWMEGPWCGGVPVRAEWTMTAPDVDILISRAVDQTATNADWDRLEFIAAHEPTVWRDLARAQRLNAQLVAEVGPLLAAADRTQLPGREDTREGWRLTPAETERHSAVLTHRLGRVASWAGWAVAAALALAVAIGPQTAGLGRGGAGPGGNSIAGGETAGMPQTAGVGSVATTAAEALSAYLAKGKAQGTVIGELPEKVIIETAPQEEGGGYEVVYLRQIMERTRVSDLYRVSSDELGNPTPVPIKTKLLPLRNGLPSGAPTEAESAPAEPVGKKAVQAPEGAGLPLGLVRPGDRSAARPTL